MNHLVKTFLFFLILSISSCGPNYIFNESYTVDQATWAYSDTINFEIDIQDSLTIYNLYLDLEHATTYYHQNLYVMIHTAFPSGKRISEQLSIELANKGGIWFGDCDSEWCQIQIPIQEGAYFNAVGKHTITLEQFMRKDNLEGIKMIGLKWKTPDLAANRD